MLFASQAAYQKTLKTISLKCFLKVLGPEWKPNRRKSCQDCNVDSKLGCLGRSWLQVGLSWRMLESQLVVFAAQVADLAIWLAGLAAPAAMQLLAMNGAGCP